MSIREDFSSYWDGNGLLAPNPCTPVPGNKASDNGPCFTSEYYVMLKMLNQLNDNDLTDFQNKIGQCINSKGMLNRVPIGQTDSLEEVDDYHGTLNACVHMGNITIPRQYLMALIRNLGFMDNTSPGTLWNWAAWLPRQPQLIACIFSAAFPSWFNPIHILLRLMAFPLYLYSAIVIALSCMGTDISNTDARRLAWHLIQATKPKSFMCWLASKIWFKRLYNDYGIAGMQAVAAIYYQPQSNNPFAKYWVND